MQTIPIQIGTVVDYIDQNVRHRGLIVDMRGDNAAIAGLARDYLDVQPKNRLVPVKSLQDTLKLFRT